MNATHTLDREPETGARPRVLAVANQKGGVGKTTTAINLGTALAALGERVLIIDLDPQGNASTGLGIDRKSRVTSSYDTLVGERALRDVIIPTAVPRLFIAPSTMDLSGSNWKSPGTKQEGRRRRRSRPRRPGLMAPSGVLMIGAALLLRDLSPPAPGRAVRRQLRNALRTYGKSSGDDPEPVTYVVVDCPPSLNLLTILMRRQELDGFVEGLFGREEMVDPPRRRGRPKRTSPTSDWHGVDGLWPNLKRGSK